MTGFLQSLPHQIPFRAASAAVQLDPETMEGIFLVSAGDALAEGNLPSQLMLFEAMAQIGGFLAFQHHDKPGFLSAIDNAVLAAPLQDGDRLTLRVTLDATFGGMYRFRGVALREGVEVASARFYLAEQPAGV